MANCEKCISKNVCRYNDGHNLYCKEDYECPHFVTADIKTEVAREIFAEIEKITTLRSGFNEKTITAVMDFEKLKQLKNKYTKEGVGE